MPKFTKKWLKDFEKRYKDAFKQIKSLEEEHAEMRVDNPDVYEINGLFMNISHLEFDNSNDLTIYHKEKTDENDEYVEIGVDGSELGSFAFKIKSFKELKEFRNKLIEAIDNFERPVEVDNTIDPNDCEEEEGWEDNEETEYTIQCSRTCVQSWTHTVMARTTCEAINKAQEGEGHDENDDFDQYGEIDWESI